MTAEGTRTSSSGTTGEPGDASFNELPVLRHERIWGFWNFSAVNVGLAIATWAFLTGGSLTLYVGARAAIAASIIGNLVGAVLVALATCIPSAKYGLEQYTALRSVFGANGVRGLLSVLFPFLAAGWNAILAIMVARAVTNVVNAALSTSFPDAGIFVIICALGAIVFSWLVLARGPVSIEWINKIVAPGLAIVTVLMLVLIFTQYSWAQLTAFEPLSPFGDPALDFMIAIELSLGAGFSWWSIMGNLARITTSQRVAFWPNLIGLFLASVVAGGAGVLAGLALGAADPTVWMIPLGGVLLGVLALAFVAFANVTSMVAQTYSVGLGLIRIGGTTLRKLAWPVLSLLLFLPAAVAVFWPATVYDNYFKFLAWVSLCLAPLCAVYFTDFYLLRRRTLSLRHLYLPDSESRYGFWRGVNPCAFVAVAAGCVTYYLTLNPATFEQAPFFRYTSASMPAFVVTAVVYLALTLLVVKPLGKGGYTDSQRAS